MWFGQRIRTVILLYFIFVTCLTTTLDALDESQSLGTLQVGAAAGTPTFANLFLEYWGNHRLPIVLGVSGMYYEVSNRGLQTDLGYAFDAVGKLRQMVGVSIVALNKSTQMSRGQRFGRFLPSTVETINQLQIYAGPLYSLDYRGVRFGAGLAMRSESLKPIFQLGYAIYGHLL